MGRRGSDRHEADQGRRLGRCAQADRDADDLVEQRRLRAGVRPEQRPDESDGPAPNETNTDVAIRAGPLTAARARRDARFNPGAVRPPRRPPPRSRPPATRPPPRSPPPASRPRPSSTAIAVASAQPVPRGVGPATRGRVQCRVPSAVTQHVVHERLGLVDVAALDEHGAEAVARDQEPARRFAPAGGRHRGARQLAGLGGVRRDQGRAPQQRHHLSRLALPQ